MNIIQYLLYSFNDGRHLDETKTAGISKIPAVYKLTFLVLDFSASLLAEFFLKSEKLLPLYLFRQFSQFQIKTMAKLNFLLYYNRYKSHFDLKNKSFFC